jgi:DMSO reductase family type II enzyme heme b subunit
VSETLKPFTEFRRHRFVSFYADAILAAIVVFSVVILTGERIDAQLGDLTNSELPDDVGSFSSKLANSPEAREAGKQIYLKRCMPCHGINGDGNGPAADTLNPRPRDFTRGLFKLRTTAWQDAPSEADHFRTVSRGVPGTAMPAFVRILTEQERWQVTYYERTFFESKFPQGQQPKEITIPAEPANNADSVAKGKTFFQEKLVCWTCHGREGRGDGPLAMAQRDDWGNPIRPRNLTKDWQYKGGSSAKDIFTRITTGLNGTPMSADFAKSLSDEDRWHLAHYVKSLQRPVKAGDVVLKAKTVNAEIPLNPDDPVWNQAEPLDITLSGQVHVPPREQNPSVDLVTVRSLFNDKEIGFLLEWDDRSKDIKNDEVPPPPAPPADQAKAGEAKSPYPTYPNLYPPTKDNKFTPYSLRDAALIQFPVKLAEGTEKPHFFLGDPSHPVNLWYWMADKNEDPQANPVEEQNANGYKDRPKVQPPDSQNVQGKGQFSNGRWRVVMKRALTTKDTNTDIMLKQGQLIPIAFHIWDGFNGETGLRRSISSWSFLLLEQPVPPKVYAYAVAGIVLAAGIEFWAIRRVRRRSAGR